MIMRASLVNISFSAIITHLPKNAFLRLQGATTLINSWLSDFSHLDQGFQKLGFDWEFE